MVCPWYRQGFCISPVLDKPSDSVTSANRCLGDFKTCKFYIDSPDTDKEGLEKFEEKQTANKLHITELMLPEVYATTEMPESPCEYFSVSTYDGKYYAFCRKKREWLVKSQISLCASYYNTCPWRE